MHPGKSCNTKAKTMDAMPRVTAVLGPTNTGKTHFAIERMLSHRTGVIGLPLRLLAREVYDKVVALRGPSAVALVTGEERIVPDRTLYWVCTVEAMPLDIGADFVAVDEIQLCADPDRGHVFTDRLINARGLMETLFLGSDTMRPAIAAMVSDPKNSVSINPRALIRRSVNTWPRSGSAHNWISSTATKSAPISKGIASTVQTQ